MTEQEIDARLSRRPIERFQWPLGAGLAVLVVSMLIGERRQRRVAPALALLLLLPSLAHAKNSGVEAYEQKDYKRAHREFSEQLKRRPNLPELEFDLGTAAYKKGDYEGAMSSFGRAMTSENPELRGKAAYNLGNTLFKRGAAQEQKEAKLGEWKNAIQQYDSALGVNPKDANASYNRDLVRKLVEELEKEQKQEEQQKQDEKKDDQKKDEEKKDEQKDQQKQDQQQNKDEQRKQDQQKQDQQKQQQQQSPDPGSEQKQEQQKDSPGQQGEQKDAKEQQSKEQQGQQGKEQDAKEQQGQKKDQQGEQGKEQKDQQGQQGQQGEKKEQGDKSEQTPTQPMEKKEGELKPAQQAQPGESQEQKDAAQAQAEAQAAAEARMTPQQARVLLESLKGEDEKVRLLDPRDGKGIRRVFKDW